MKKALIFGVTGQDGSYLTDLLLSKDYHVVGVARRTSTPNDERIRHVLGHKNFQLVKGDVTDPMCVHRLVCKHYPYSAVAYDDYVNPCHHKYEIYNLAAQSHVGISFEEPNHTTQATYLGCLNILESIRSLHPYGGVRFYQASSSEMFGSSTSLDYRVLDSPEIDPVHCVDGLSLKGESLSDRLVGHIQDENTPMLPNSPYAIAKLAAHHACRLYRKSYGIFACSGILFNHESERRGIEFVTRKIARYSAKLGHYYKCMKIENMETAIKAVGKLGLGNLTAQRDWGHAEDYVRGMRMMLQHKTPDDYVLATGQTRSVMDFLVASYKVMGLNPGSIADSVYQDPQFMRPCEVHYLKGSADKARRVLGWRPEVSFDKLVERMVLYEVECLKQGNN